jgi:NAD(P)-dependent dehydrogenase (short-subunit alcohol dehydrogenase family)
LARNRQLISEHAANCFERNRQSVLAQEIQTMSGQSKRTTPKTIPVVLITGATSGFGQTMARHLAAHGYRVFGTGRKPASADDYTMLTLDVRDDQSAQACVAEVIRQAGRIDVLINNAGYVGPFAASEELDMDQLRAVFETNFFGTVRMTNIVLPIMRAQQAGCVISISSAAGLVSAPPFSSAYASSKHALEGYIGALRHEVHPFNIRIALIEPGYFKTNIGQTIEPPARPLAVYASARQRSAAIERFAVDHGDDPQKVAQLAQRIIEQARPALHHPISFESQSAYWLSRPAAGLYERLLHWLYDSDNHHQTIMNDGVNEVNEPTGLRRYVFDKAVETVWMARLNKAVSFAAPIGAALIISSLFIGRRRR